MTIDSYMNTQVYIKRKTGIDMYGKPIYEIKTIMAKVEERLEKYISTTDEKFIAMTIIYSKEKIEQDDLVSIDGEEFYPILTVEKVRNMLGQIMYYKGYTTRGAL
jgi:hypothetical protein